MSAVSTKLLFRVNVWVCDEINWLESKRRSFVCCWNAGNSTNEISSWILRSRQPHRVTSGRLTLKTLDTSSKRKVTKTRVCLIACYNVRYSPNRQSVRPKGLCIPSLQLIAVANCQSVFITRNSSIQTTALDSVSRFGTRTDEDDRVWMHINTHQSFTAGPNGCLRSMCYCSSDVKSSYQNQRFFSFFLFLFLFPLLTTLPAATRSKLQNTFCYYVPTITIYEETHLCR